MPRQTWEESFADLEKFFEENGHSKVPAKHPHLGMWVVNQRSANKHNLLTEEQRTQLNTVQFQWETLEERFDRQWNEMFNRLQVYRRERLGTSMDTRGYFEDDQTLKRWVQTQQTNYRQDTIREDRKNKLDEVGFLWVRNPNLVGLDRDWKIHEDAWDANFEKLELFIDIHGHTMVQPDHDDDSLYKWVIRQRVQFKNNTLRNDRKQRLDDVGFVWAMTDHCDAQKSLKQRNWDKMFERLVAFRQEHGHVNCGRGHTDQELANWVLLQRGRLVAGTLDNRRAERLESLGFVTDVFSEAWDAKYDKLASFYAENGHSNVPDGHELSGWSRSQRSARRDNESRLTPYRIRKLEQLDFVWDVLEGKWSRMFQRLVHYKNEHGDCNVPDRYENDMELGNWVKRQRSLNRGSKPGGLEDRKKRLLDDIGFIWTGMENWEEKYAKLVKYNSENKHCDVPYYHKDLGRWVSYQRKIKAEGTLSKDKETKLNSIGFTWDFSDEKKDRIWNELLEKLARYNKKHNTFSVPRNSEEGKKLNKWVSRQRSLEKSGKLPGDRKQQLDAIGFPWSPQKTAKKRKQPPVSNLRHCKQTKKR